MMGLFDPATWLDDVMTWIVVKATEAIGTILAFVTGAPEPVDTETLFGGALDGPFSTAAGIGLWLLPIFVLLGIITWTARGEPGRILHLLLIETPLAAVAMLLLPLVVGELSGIADAMFEGIVATVDLEAEFVDMLTVLGEVDGAGLLLVLAVLLMLLGGLATYIVLLVRPVVIAAAVMLGPMLVATRTWEPTRGFVARWFALTGVVVLIKPVIAITWLVGAALTGSVAPGDVTSASDPAVVTAMAIAGAAVLLLGGLVPAAMFRLVPAMGERVASSLHTGVGRTSMPGMALPGVARGLFAGMGGGATTTGGGASSSTSGVGGNGAGTSLAGSPGASVSVPVGAYGSLVANTEPTPSPGPLPARLDTTGPSGWPGTTGNVPHSTSVPTGHGGPGPGAGALPDGSPGAGSAGRGSPGGVRAAREAVSPEPTEARQVAAGTKDGRASEMAFPWPPRHQPSGSDAGADQEGDR